MKQTIIDLRKKAKLTQVELALRLNVHVATVKQWESGMQPNEENATKIKRLCTLYSVEVE